MKFQNLAITSALVPCALAFPHLANYPRYRSLAGLSEEEVRYVARQFDQYDSYPGPQPLPPPINYTGPMLVNDADHPFEPLQPGDIRGPCPGLNTLASHGYINRNGVVTPADIITAVQEGFNMGFQFASFLCYSAFITDGNHLTNMMTIGSNTTVNSQLVTGIDTHGHFEGDASITRQDAYLGDAITFDPSLFDVLSSAANSIGGGNITVEAAAYDRASRVNNSIANNPEFFYETPRFLGATAESGFMLAMFASNQTADTSIPVTVDEANYFFNMHMFPDGFYRRQAPYDFPELVPLTNTLIEMVGAQPGTNNGVNNYVVTTMDDASFCLFYQKQVNLTAQLYPNPTGDLKQAIKTNLNTYYQALANSSCPQLFPYGM